MNKTNKPLRNVDIAVAPDGAVSFFYNRVELPQIPGQELRLVDPERVPLIMLGHNGTFELFKE